MVLFMSSIFIELQPLSRTLKIPLCDDFYTIKPALSVVTSVSLTKSCWILKFDVKFLHATLKVPSLKLTY